jgi:hypothetical protein
MLRRRLVLRLLAPMAIGVVAFLPTSSARAIPTTVTATLTLTMSGGDFSGLQVILGPFTGTVDLTKSGGHFVNMSIPAGFAAISAVLSTSAVLTAQKTVGATRYEFAAAPGPNSAGNFAIGQANLIGRMPINGLAALLRFAPGNATSSVYLPLSALGLSTTKAASHVAAQGTAWSATATTPSHLSLVTPMRITTQNLPNFPANMTLTAHLDIPEPATGIMIGVAAATLSAIGWRKRRQARARQLAIG